MCWRVLEVVELLTRCSEGGDERRVRDEVRSRRESGASNSALRSSRGERG